MNNKCNLLSILYFIAIMKDYVVEVEVFLCSILLQVV